MSTIDPVVLFGIEVAASLALSLLILARLQGLLRSVGEEASARAGASSRFWLAYLQLMMVLAPLALVAFCSRAGTYYVPVQQLQSAVFSVLLGQTVGLALVGRAVWKSIPKGGTT